MFEMGVQDLFHSPRSMSFGVTGDAGDITVVYPDAVDQPGVGDVCRLVLCLRSQLLGLGFRVRVRG